MCCILLKKKFIFYLIYAKKDVAYIFGLVSAILLDFIDGYRKYTLVFQTLHS